MRLDDDDAASGLLPLELPLVLPLPARLPSVAEESDDSDDPSAPRGGVIEIDLV